MYRCFAFLLPVLLSLVAAQAVRAQTADEVIESLRKRGERTTSLQVEWKGKAFDCIDREPGRTKPEDLNFDSAGMLAQDDGRYRFALRGIRWSEELEKAQIIEQVWVYEKGIVKSLWWGPALVAPYYTERERTLDRSINHQLNMAIRLAYWPVDPEFGVLRGKGKETTLETKPLAGRDHLVLRVDNTEVWVDPAREMLPVRCHRYVEGHLLTAVELKYIERDKEWELAGWNFNYSMGPGILNRDYQETVTALRRNEKLADDLFKLEKPAVP